MKDSMAPAQCRAAGEEFSSTFWLCGASLCGSADLGRLPLVLHWPSSGIAQFFLDM